MQQKPYSESLILTCRLQQFSVRVFYPSFGGFPLPQAGIFILLSFFSTPLSFFPARVSVYGERGGGGCLLTEGAVVVEREGEDSQCGSLW